MLQERFGKQKGGLALEKVHLKSNSCAGALNKNSTVSRRECGMEAQAGFAGAAEAPGDEEAPVPGGAVGRHGGSACRQRGLFLRRGVRRGPASGTGGGCELPPAAAAQDEPAGPSWGRSAGTGSKSTGGSSQASMRPRGFPGAVGALCGAGPSASRRNAALGLAVQLSGAGAGSRRSGMTAESGTPNCRQTLWEALGASLEAFTGTGEIKARPLISILVLVKATTGKGKVCVQGTGWALVPRVALSTEQHPPGWVILLKSARSSWWVHRCPQSPAGEGVWRPRAAQRTGCWG